MTPTPCTCPTACKLHPETIASRVVKRVELARRTIKVLNEYARTEPTAEVLAELRRRGVVYADQLTTVRLDMAIIMCANSIRSGQLTPEPAALTDMPADPASVTAWGAV